jgi:cyclohexadienyl dehydratase
VGRASARRGLHDARRAGSLTSRPALLALCLLAACARAVPDDASLPVLRIGTSGDYPPFSTIRDGAFEGFDVAVARRFAADTGRRVELVRFRWPDLTTDLAAGRFEIAMSGVTMRPERTLVGSFTRPVVETGAVVLTRTGIAGVPTDLDRMGLRMGVNAGGHLEQVARRLYRHALLVPQEDNTRLAALLASGTVDAVMTDGIEAPIISAKVPGTVRLGPVSHDRKAYLGRDPVAVADLDAWLAAREGDGTLAELRKQWLGPAYGGRRGRFASDLAALMAAIDLRLAFMPAVAAAKERARIPVRDRAQEARVVAAARAQAATLGLDPAAVEALMRAQLAAARTIQEEFLAAPVSDRPPVPVLDLDRDARPALARLSEEILARAAVAAASGPALAGVDPAVLAGMLDPVLTPARSRHAIADAVAGLAHVRTSCRQPPGPSYCPATCGAC